MNACQLPMTLTATQVVYALSDLYEANFLLLRVADLFEEERVGHKKPVICAKTRTYIGHDNPLLGQHKHGYPGVMQIEFAQQLGVLIARKALGVEGLPFMRSLDKLEIVKPLNAGDTAHFKTTLLWHKLGTFSFEAEVVKEEPGCGEPVMIHAMRFNFIGQRVKQQ